MPEISEPEVDPDVDADSDADGDASPGVVVPAQRASEELASDAETIESADDEGVEDADDAETGAVSADPKWQPIVLRQRIPIGLTTVVLMVGIVVRLGVHWSTLPVLAFAVPAVALAVIDFAILRLPNPLVATSGVLVVLTCAIQALAEHHTHELVAGLEGAVGVTVFYLMLYAVSRGGLGLGDVKLGAVAGFLMASRDWEHVFNGTFLAYLVTLVIAVGMMVIQGRKKFPYGPGILAGTIAVMLLS